MAHSIEQKQELKYLYIHSLLPLNKAADRMNIAIGTARRWKKKALEEGDDWDKLRAASSMAGKGAEDLVKGLINDFVVLHQTVVDDIKNDEKLATIDKVKSLSCLADAFSKTMNAAGKASPEISKMSVAYDIIEMLTHFIAKNYSEYNKVFIKILEPFAEEVSAKYE